MSFLNNIRLKYLYLFLFALPLCLYYNSANNEYAFDDDIIVLGGKFNWAVCYFNLNNYDSAIVIWDKGFSVFDSSPHRSIYAELCYNRAITEGQNKQSDNAVKLLEFSTRTFPGKAAYWSDLGGAYYSVNRFEDAKNAWEKTLSLDPSNDQANKALPFIKQKLAEFLD